MSAVQKIHEMLVEELLTSKSFRENFLVYLCERDASLKDVLIKDWPVLSELTEAPKAKTTAVATAEEWHTLAASEVIRRGDQWAPVDSPTRWRLVEDSVGKLVSRYKKSIFRRNGPVGHNPMTHCVPEVPHGIPARNSGEALVGRECYYWNVGGGSPDLREARRGVVDGFRDGMAFKYLVTGSVGTQHMFAQPVELGHPWEGHPDHISNRAPAPRDVPAEHRDLTWRDALAMFPAMGYSQYQKPLTPKHYFVGIEDAKDRIYPHDFADCGMVLANFKVFACDMCFDDQTPNVIHANSIKESRIGTDECPYSCWFHVVPENPHAVAQSLGLKHGRDLIGIQCELMRGTRNGSPTYDAREATYADRPKIAAVEEYDERKGYRVGAATWFRYARPVNYAERGI